MSQHDEYLKSTRAIADLATAYVQAPWYKKWMFPKALGRALQSRSQATLSTLKDDWLVYKASIDGELTPKSRWYELLWALIQLYFFPELATWNSNVATKTIQAAHSIGLLEDTNSVLAWFKNQYDSAFFSTCITVRDTQKESREN
jgi:hypothetical protein